MKNTRKVLVGSLALLTAISMGAMSGTYARYTSEIVDKTDTARVAKWNINKVTTVDLFKDSYLSDAIKSSNTDKVVAPGASGSYEFGLAADGEVETNYTIDATITGTDTINTDEYAPIVYTLDGTEYNSIDDLTAAIKALYSGKVFAAGTISESKHTIGWSWALDATDEADKAATNAKDTAKAAANGTVTLNVKLTATQSENAAN